MTPKILLKLTEKYCEPHRYYHTLTHPSDLIVLAQRDLKMNLKPEQIMALWFHDVVYDIPQKEKGMNEKKSADFARDILSVDFDKDFVEAVATIILDTIDHVPTCSLSPEVLDLDLSVLGSWSFYGEYVNLIEEEYTHIDIQEFVVERIKFLETMLKKEKLYYTELFQKEYEVTAKMNMNEELLNRVNQLASIDSFHSE